LEETLFPFTVQSESMGSLWAHCGNLKENLCSLFETVVIISYSPLEGNAEDCFLRGKECYILPR